MINSNIVQSFLLDGAKSARESVELFVGELIKLVKALGFWAIPFVLSIVAIALLPTVMSTHLGQLTDAIIGARGIGAMTADVTQAIRVLIGATVVGFLAEMFLFRFEGRSGVLARTAYGLSALFVLAITLINLGWPGVALWPIVLLFTRLILKKIPYLQYFFVLPVVLLFLSCSTKVIHYAVIRAITVGAALSTVAVAGVYTVVVARLLLKQNER